MMVKTFNYKSVPVLPTLECITDKNGRVYQLPNGSWVPSVTTVLSHFKQKELAGWRRRVGDKVANRKMNIAAKKGTKFHDLVENYLVQDQDKVSTNIMP